MLSNIVLRSGVADRAPDVTVDVCSSREGWIQFAIVNEVIFASEKEREEAEKNIADVKELLARNDPASFLDRSRGTGYARVQKILTHDLKCDHRIEFDLISGNKFKAMVEVDARHLKVS